MSAKALVNDEKTLLNLILEDLRYLFNKEEIDSSELNTVLNNLKSDEAKTYIYNLFAGSKPETALRESFFTSDGALAKFLFGYAKSSPEVVENGFVDYLIKDEFGHTVVLELKSLFDSQKEKDKAGAIKVKKLKQQVLDWLKHKEQIKSYITKGDYVILTNLNEWFFFSRSLNPIDPEPFFTTSLHEFIVEYENYGKNFKEFCDRKEYQSVRYELDKEFLRSLDLWVKKLSVVKFKVDEKKKLELIIGLINKFIFIQTLDDYGVIGFKWIQNNWQYYENQWAPKGKVMILEEFLGAVDKWFFKYYDTELFREGIFEYIENNKENMGLFYENLRDVLGVTYLQKRVGFKGIIQYNFRLIDEDVLGKAYEAFLAEVRKEEGVYYTPKYITQYIAENTVGKIFNEKLAAVKEKLENEDYEKAKELVKEFISIRVLDPACGSGSFLIKAIRIIVEKYKELIHLIQEYIKRYSNYAGTLDLPQESRTKLELLHEMKEIVGPENDRELIARILVRHIHGVDLDKRALEVAKVNIWLEAIKLAPKEFRYDKLPPDTNYILPNLEMNLCNGDSVVGLPESLTLNYLKDNCKADLIEISRLRKNYLENPVNPSIMEEIKSIQRKIAQKLDEIFTRFLESKGISLKIFDQTKPFHWALEFWYVFFDEQGNVLEENLRGMDIIIGNPPYIKAKLMNETIRRFLDAVYSSATASYDVYVVFIEKAIQLLKKNGYLGFINPSKFAFTDYGLGIRKLVKEQAMVNKFIDFGDAQVFDEATNYTCLLFLKKKEEQEYSFRVARVMNRAINLPPFIENLKKKIETFEEFRENDYKIFTVPSNALAIDGWLLIPLSKQQILKKIKADNPRLEEFTHKIFQGLVITPVEVFALSITQQLGRYVKVKPIKPEDEKEEYIIEKDLLVPILKSSDIHRYFISAGNYYVIFPYKYVGKKGVEFDTVFIEEDELKTKYPKTFEYLVNKRHFLERREEGRWKGSPRWYEYSRAQNFGCHPLLKIITPGISTGADYALDEDGYYIDRGSYGIILKEEVNISYKYLLALLNSKVLDFVLKSTSPFVSGGYYSYQTKYLNSLPIKIAGKTQIDEIEQLIDRIIILKIAHHKFLEIWNEWSIKLKSNEYTLDKILRDDSVLTKKGMFDKAWTNKVTFYPPESEDTNVYNNFKIEANQAGTKIQIFGLDENNKEQFVYEMEFKNRDLMLHIYCSLLEALGSRAKIEKLDQLFSKTSIPIISEVNRSSNELTPNIIKKVKEEFERWLKEKQIIGVEADIVRIYNEIEDLEAKIDALVFKLYELNEDEIKIIFDSLKTPTMYQSKVFDSFRKL